MGFALLYWYSHLPSLTLKNDRGKNSPYSHEKREKGGFLYA